MLIECRGSTIFTPPRERARDAQATILQSNKGHPAPPHWIRKALVKFRDCAGIRKESIPRGCGWILGTTILYMLWDGELGSDGRLHRKTVLRKHINEFMGPLRDLSPVILMARMEEE
jgi:hypothetical protein